MTTTSVIVSGSSTHGNNISHKQGTSSGHNICHKNQQNQYGKQHNWQKHLPLNTTKKYCQYLGQLSKNHNIINKNILQTPSKPGVF